MVIAIHQPHYLPWLAYCDKAAACDVFVYLDSVQFQKNGVQNRNQIKTRLGAAWLTIPVHASLGLTIREMAIASEPWRRKHIKTLELNYAHAPYRTLVAEFREILEQEEGTLADLNITTTEWLFHQLGIKCLRVRSSSISASGRGDDLIVSLCRELGATEYLSGTGARVYQEESKFHDAGIGLRYQQYQPQPYSQCFPEIGFVPGLSALDAVLNLGPNAREAMLAGRGTIVV
jgi:hypothetical protein